MVPKPARALRVRTLRSQANNAAGYTEACPRTEEGKELIRHAHLIHGRRTNEAIAAQHESAELGRQLRTEIRDVETWAVEQGLLKKTWRRDWAL